PLSLFRPKKDFFSCSKVSVILLLQFTETSGKFRGVICTKDVRPSSSNPPPPVSASHARGLQFDLQGNDHVVVTVNGSDLANTWHDKFTDIVCQMDLRLRVRSPCNGLRRYFRLQTKQTTITNPWVRF